MILGSMYVGSKAGDTQDTSPPDYLRTVLTSEVLSSVSIQEKICGIMYFFPLKLTSKTPSVKQENFLHISLLIHS